MPDTAVPSPPSAPLAPPPSSPIQTIRAPRQQMLPADLETSKPQPNQESPQPPAPEKVEGESRDIIRGSIVRNILGVGQEKKDEKKEPEAAKGETKGDTQKGETEASSAQPAGSTQKESQQAEAPAPASKRKPRGKPIASIDTEHLVASTAKAVGGAVVQAIQAAPPVRTSPETAELPDEVRGNLQVYQELHRVDPKKYPADLAQRIARFAKTELEYADKWESQHPGETFDGTAEEHEGWYDSHQPKVDPNDFAYARAALRVREDVAQQYEPKIRELEGQVRQFKIEPQIHQAATSAALPIIQAIDPEVKELSQDSVTSFKTKDPIGFEVAQQVENVMRGSIVAAGQLWHGITKLDPNNPTHKVAQQAFAEVQELVKHMPASQQVSADGKRFVPLADYYNLPEEARQHVFTISYDDIVYYISHKIAPALTTDLYKNRKAEVERMAGLLGYVRQGPAQKKEERNGSTTQPAAPQLTSPSVGAGEPRSANGPSGQTPPANYNEFFFNRLLGR